MARSKTIRIGLSARLFHPRDGAMGIESKTLQVLEQSIAQWVMSRDVLVLMVPSILKDGPIHRSNIRLRDYADYLDGLVLQGGTDVSPEAYGETPLKDEWAGDRVRDAYEMELLHEFVEAGKPVLGICRGLQLINVAFGGALYQDLQTQHPGALQHRNATTYDQHFHDIHIVADSHLAKLYPDTPRARVNSIHHQGIKRVAPDFVVEALSEPDGVPEAIRLKPAPGRGYIAATQWHPEFHRAGSDTLDDTAILNDFLAACAQAKANPPARRGPPAGLRDRATRLLRSALRRDKAAAP